MNTKAKELIRYLQDGFGNEKKQVEIEIDLGIFRNQITKIILDYKLPIGSYHYGYFLINTQDELDKSINAIDKRIQGLLRRKEAIIFGWEERKKIRVSENINYPKEDKFQ